MGIEISAYTFSEVSRTMHSKPALVAPSLLRMKSAYPNTAVLFV